MIPFLTTTDLLPHQKEALEKVLPTRVSGLFMDMGTGKSRTTIELAKVRAEKIDHVIWVCPVSLKETICHEILKHTNCTKEDIYVFDDKTTDASIPKNRRWYVVGIESLSLSGRVTVALNAIITARSFVVVDESSYIKGPSAMRTKRITNLAQRARYRTILTGTPISQGVVDLYSQMYFLSPKILGYNSFYSFASNHLEYHPTHPQLIVRSHNIPYLAEKIKPYVYQCTKDECLGLPSKIYDTYISHLTEEQEEEYTAAKLRFMDEVTRAEEHGQELSPTAIFKLFTELQTICCGFITKWDAISKERKTNPIESNRLDCLLSAAKAVPEKEKVIIWAKYTYSVSEICAALKKEYGEDAVTLLHGALSPKAREQELKRFEGASRFMIATQSCGGHGLNLQFCCYQIFYANGFKYSERLQAEDRCHRHGQRRKVTYIDIYISDSIDMRIAEALSKKGDAVKSFRDEVERIKKDRGVQTVNDLVMSL